MNQQSEKDQLHEIMEREPELTAFGFGIWEDTKVEDRERKFAEDRRSLAEDVQRFVNTKQWIEKRLIPRKTINDRHSSYGMKHIAEKEVGYLHNGVFIAAMIACGYRYKRYGRSPNAYFNVEEKAVRKAEKIAYGF